MNTSEYIISKQVKVEEVEREFELIGTLEESIPSRVCPNCRDRINAREVPSEAWTKAIVCNHCDSISIVFIHDRMGGIGSDFVKIFGNKKGNEPIKYIVKND